MFLVLMAGMALAACGPSMGPNYAQECLPSIRWNQPGLVAYQFPEPGAARLTVFDPAGRVVLSRAFRAGQEGSVRLDQSRLGRGRYFALVERGPWQAGSARSVLR
ncbi:MAG: hypothetical protein R6X13_08700 [bacterium]